MEKERQNDGGMSKVVNLIVDGMFGQKDVRFCKVRDQEKIWLVVILMKDVRYERVGCVRRRMRIKYDGFIVVLQWFYSILFFLWVGGKNK